MTLQENHPDTAHAIFRLQARPTPEQKLSSAPVPEDPFAIIPTSTGLASLKRRLPVYEADCAADRFAASSPSYRVAELDEIFVGAVRHRLRLECARFVLERGLQPTTRNDTAEKMRHYTHYGLNLFTTAPVVSLMGDLALATNSMHLKIYPDQEGASINYTLSNVFSAMRARVMCVTYRKPRYIEHACDGSVKSGTLEFIKPN